MRRTGLMMIFALMLGAPIAAQPCNPAIDGTYCASAETPKLDLSLPKQPDFAPIQSLGTELSTPSDQTQPGTFGAISFRSDGTKCFGLLRRSDCR